MTQRVSLRGNPRWWINFLGDANSLKGVQEKLELCNAKYIYELSTGKSYIEFEDERYYSMFVLRYS